MWFRAKIAIIAMLLPGCAAQQPTWHEVVDHNFLKIVTVTKGQCKAGERACATLGKNGVCNVTMGPDADMCSLMHELAHCAGWNHVGPDAGCGEQAYAQARERSRNPIAGGPNGNGITAVGATENRGQTTVVR